jgi:ribosomal protein S18 acetylase RimI-like enzyme
VESPPVRFAAFARARLEEDGIAVRSATPADAGLICAIYGTTRDEELRQVAWTPEQKQAFTDWQSGQQEAHYALHYPNAELLLVESAGHPIGRIYVDTTASEVRLMEVTLMPSHRKQRIGTRLMEELLRYADALGRPASLHVEPFNPAKGMYERMGFVVRDTRGLYEFMVRPVPPS